MFYVVNLDVRQSRRANDTASIVKHAKKGFAKAKARESAAGGQMPQLPKEFESVNKLFGAFIQSTGYVLSCNQQVTKE